MASFQCALCGKIVDATKEQCCAPAVLCKEKIPICCGKPMMELMDD
ncbi:MAG: hypothetical protein HY930_04335 [Euryarchaeota archaeon]|nr:hypothetical protein [Euryarchaeota archaeon]